MEIMNLLGTCDNLIPIIAEADMPTQSDLNGLATGTNSVSRKTLPQKRYTLGLSSSRPMLSVTEADASSYV
jgi:hypothetical protein